MRLAILKFAYPDYLRQLYARDPRLRELGYAEQRRALDRDGSWWADSWSPALRPLGYEVAEIVMNAEPMQRAWAREHGVHARGPRRLLDVVERQLAALRPDVLFVQSFGALSSGSLRMLRERCPSLRAVLGWKASPETRGERTLDHCDAVLSCVPEVVEELAAAGHRSFHMDHAFDRRVGERLAGRPPRSFDLTFAGNVLDQRQHGDRLRLLRAIGRETPMHVFTELRPHRLPVRAARVLAARSAYAGARALATAGVERSTLHALPFVGIAGAWRDPPRMLPTPVPRSNMHEAVYGMRMLDTLRRSRVTLNAHTSVSPRSASNLRLFEATGAGACLLTDQRRNLPELFEPDREVVAYESAADAVEKARWLLDHPAEREEIERAARLRVLREHTYDHRAPVLDRAIRSVLARA